MDPLLRRVKYKRKVKVSMVCPKCRQQVRDDARYCHLCGTKLSPSPEGRAVNDVYLVAKAVAVTLILNYLLAVLLAKLGDPFVPLTADYLAAFIGSMLFGLVLLLLLEFVGNYFHFFNKDWSLIMAWKRAWQKKNYLMGIFLSFAMGWWWMFLTISLVLSLTWGFLFVIVAALFLAPVLGLFNWVLGWIYAFLTAILDRFLVLIPYIPTEEDRQRVEQLLKSAYDSLQQRMKRRS
jgi:hypothetical protein